ncbi:MAG: hypothetical protein HEQ20_27140 [Aphanizomenon flos-aquae KM1D3_PB]|uniref:hypothetical protein n=1 Tax=Aphanizomenon flos-aquae TaxID=1176 RepID=UPI000A542E75|nr:hypothetical protein [Aphanizomenon flos-aquae]QSV73779.1 MAG: hypothetical protein HEQ20_27140 [Aphanizomenon flos-aquae KM1D3_PB]
MILAFTGVGIGEFASEVTGYFLSHAETQREFSFMLKILSVHEALGEIYGKFLYNK